MRPTFSSTNSRDALIGRQARAGLFGSGVVCSICFSLASSAARAMPLVSLEFRGERAKIGDYGIASIDDRFGQPAAPLRLLAEVVGIFHAILPPSETASLNGPTKVKPSAIPQHD